MTPNTPASQQSVADHPTLASSMQALLEERQGQRSKQGLQQLGLPTDYTPPPVVTYQDCFPPPPPRNPALPIPIESVDRPYLVQQAGGNNEMAQLALQQLNEQTQQHVLTTAERDFLRAAWAKTLLPAGDKNNDTNESTD